MVEDISKEQPSENRIAIYCPADQLGEFLTGLLGKPQTIDHHLKGSFDIGRDDLLGLHHLIEQRIHDQNEAQLVQFVASLGFNDGLSVEIGSISDFQSYAEVRSLITQYVSLSWIYLIKFRGRKTPERQQIEVTFSTGTNDQEALFLHDGFRILRSHRTLRSTGVVVRINHTMRSWGMDFESLLTDHIRIFLNDKRQGVPKFLNSYSSQIGFVTFAAMGLAFGAVGGRLLRFITHGYHGGTISPTAPLSDLVASESHKIDFLYSFVVGKGAILGTLIFLYLLSSIALAAAAAIYVTTTATRDVPSFILFTVRDQRFREAELEKYNNGWLKAAITFGLSVLAGVVANAFKFIS